MAASPRGGCVAGPVTDASGALLAGDHVFFADPTGGRYGHGVLGDTPEWGSLNYIRQGMDGSTDGQGPQGPQVRSSVLLPRERVFEDIAPRLIDVDGDGRWEIVVVESHVRLGAQLAVYDIEDGQLVKRAATPHIGTAFRWLAPLGGADLDGDGRVELAYVDRPHLARTLRVWRYVDGALEPVAALRGVTNHRIGDDFITGGIRDCGNGPEIVTVDGAWRVLVATRLVDGVLAPRQIGPYAGSASMEAALACR